MADWITLADAINSISEARGIPRAQAIARVLSLAKDGQFRSRIALVVDRSLGAPRPNVSMNDSHWRELEESETDWIEAGSVDWDDGQAWRGIQIHGGDLALSNGPNRGQSGAKLQPAANRNSPARDDLKASDDESGDWIRIGEAAHSLHLLLKERLDGTDPAPWIERPRKITDQVETETTLRHREMVRTSLTMRRALLSGEVIRLWPQQRASCLSWVGSSVWHKSQSKRQAGLA